MRMFKRIWTLGSNELYNEAMRLFNEHNYREAIAKFEELLAQKRSRKSLHYNLSLVYASQSHRNLGVVLFATGSYREALEEFRLALHFNPDYNELNYFIGVCQNNLGDFMGAIDSFNTVLSVDPHNLPVALRLGIVLHNNKMWDRAISLYKEILLKNPHYADIHYNLGLACLGQGQVSRALTSFESALEINSNYLQARIKIVVAHIYLGKLDEAFAELQGLISAFPDYADLHYYLGLVRTSRSEWEDAKNSFARALEINPSYKEAKIKLAAVYCYLDQFDKGLQELEELHAVDPGDGDVATMLLAIRGVLSSARGENFAGLLRKMLKDREITKNIPEFNKSIRINPDVSEMVAVILSVADEDAPLTAMLIPLVKNHIAEHPAYPDVHNSLGTLYMKVNQPAEAEACFAEAIRLNPQYVKARLNLFYAQKSLGKHEEAAKHGALLAAAGASYPDFYCALAEVYLDGSRCQEARANAVKAIELNPYYARAHYVLGRCHEADGEKGLALEQYETCLEMKPPHEIQVVVQDRINKLRRT
jgi:tetratricopeptide (TPR) repeat protein